MKFNIVSQLLGLSLIVLGTYRSVDAEPCMCPFFKTCMFNSISIVKDAEIYCSKNTTDIDDISIRHFNETTIATGIFDAYTNLRVIELLHGSIQHIKPGVFENLSTLQRLVIRRNNISTLEDYTFRGLGALEKLDLYSNNLTSIAPYAFNGLKSLNRLILSGNKLTALPAEIFSSSPMLKSIMLSENLLTHLPDGIFDNIDFLLRLDITNNRLETFRFPDLKVMLLFLHNNSLSSLYINDHVKAVQANHNQIRTIEGTGRNATELWLHNNAISDITPINRMTNLLNLILNNNPLQPDSVIDSLPYLQALLVRNTSIKISENTFVNLNSMLLLDLSNNNLTQLDFWLFASMINLKTLILAQNHIQMINFIELRGYLPALRILEICDNGWNATYMEHMQQHMKHHKLTGYWEELPEGPVFLSFFVDICSESSGKRSVEYVDYTYDDDINDIEEHFNELYSSPRTTSESLKMEDAYNTTITTTPPREDVVEGSTVAVGSSTVASVVDETPDDQQKLMASNGDVTFQVLVYTLLVVCLVVLGYYVHRRHSAERRTTTPFGSSNDLI